MHRQPRATHRPAARDPPSPNDLRYKRPPRRPAHRINNVEHALPAALAEVERAELCLLAIQRRKHVVPRGRRGRLEPGRRIERGDGRPRTLVDRAWLERVQCEQVARREIHHVQVVAHAGPVPAVRSARGERAGRPRAPGRVVVPKDLEHGVLHAADGHLGEQWEEVARAAARVFSDEARRVCAGRAVVL